MELDNKIKDKLLSYQVNHVTNLISILNKNITALDSSDTGTGKTYTAIAICAQLKLKPIILCPKSVIYTWKKVCETFGVEPFMIVNYETIKIGKYYKNGNRQKCPYIEVKNEEFKWKLDYKDKIFIFDEVHRCNNIETLNGKLLYYTKQSMPKVNMLLLSATVSDHPEKFRIFFYILNFIDPDQVMKQNLSYEKYQYILTKWIFRDARPLFRINGMLYPDRAARMRIDVLGDLFPETQITAQPYTVDKKREIEIEREYSVIQKELDRLRDKKDKDKMNVLVKILRSQQKIELLKAPLFVELANDFLENKFSIVIFVNYTQTLKLISKMLNTTCLIWGEQTGDERDKNIRNFMENKERVIICNIKAGSVGLSLHDVQGGHPRVSLISPTWSSIDLTQALGRIHRAGGKSKSLQRIVYVANTVEERIADKVQKKIKDINTINNGDLDLTNIVFERERKKL